MPLARVVPATLTATFTTSVAGAAAYAVLAMASTPVRPIGGWVWLRPGRSRWRGYLGARLQLHLPETALRLQFGTLAAALGALCAAQTLG